MMPSQKGMAADGRKENLLHSHHGFGVVVADPGSEIPKGWSKDAMADDLPAKKEKTLREKSIGKRKKKKKQFRKSKKKQSKRQNKKQNRKRNLKKDKKLR